MKSRGGRRQWEESALLRSTAMGKPFEVTVMHDISEQTERSDGSIRRDVSTNEPRKEKSPILDKEAISLGSDPSAEEVGTSIDALQPESTFLATSELIALGNTLSDRYNTKQLSMYLRHALKVSSNEFNQQTQRSSATKRGSGGVKRSLWQAGRTDISKRLVQMKEGRRVDTGRSKKSVVHRIIHVVWGLRSNEETQSLGELELVLPTWQFSYLFSLSADGTPLHQFLIDTPFLRKTSVIQPYHLDNVMRITARRGDAEEIADQIQRNLINMVTLKTDMVTFRDIFQRDSLEAELKKTFHASICAEVGRRTSTFVELVGTQLCIYGNTDHDVQTANRILLSFLHLPSRATARALSPSFLDALEHRTERLQNLTLSYEHGDSQLALRHRSRKLGRLILPSETVDKAAEKRRSTAVRYSRHTPSSGMMRRAARNMAVYLYLHPPPAPVQVAAKTWPTAGGQPPVNGLITSPWRIDVGCLVLPGQVDEYDALPALVGRAALEQLRKTASSEDQTLLRSRIPNLTGFLSYYTPVGGGREHESSALQTLVAHFMPSPFTKEGLGLLQRLPRIEVIYDTSQLRSPLRHIKAIMAKQSVHLPLPGEAVDLCFVRDVIAYANPVNMRSDSMSQFTETLLTSPGRGLDSLRSEGEVLMKIPTSWLADSNFENFAEEDGLSTVPYQFDRFEVKETSTFAPSVGNQAGWVDDVPMRHILTDKAIRVHYQEVNGGIIGGSRKGLSISRDLGLGGTEKLNGKPETAQVQKLTELVDAGLHIARAFSRLGSGELRPAWEYDAGRKPAHVRSQDAFDCE